MVEFSLIILSICATEKRPVRRTNISDR